MRASDFGTSEIPYALNSQDVSVRIRRIKQIGVATVIITSIQCSIDLGRPIVKELKF